MTIAGDHTVEIKAIGEFGANRIDILRVTLESEAKMLNENSNSGGNIRWVFTAFLARVS